MPKIVCMKCGLEMRVELIGITVVEMAHSPPTPYKSWQGDIQKCHNCGHEVTGKYALETFEHQEGFWENLRDTPDEKIVVAWEKSIHVLPIDRALEYLRTIIREKMDDE